VSTKQAQEAGIQAPVQWALEMGWHDRVGNGNQLLYVGLVLLAALANLRIHPEAPKDILSIEPASQPDGLSCLKGTYMLKVGDKTFPVGVDKDFAYAAHKKVHETCTKHLRTTQSLEFSHPKIKTQQILYIYIYIHAYIYTAFPWCLTIYIYLNIFIYIYIYIYMSHSQVGNPSLPRWFRF
jgi:hypothetical protein